MTDAADGLAVARNCIQCGKRYFADLAQAADGMCDDCLAMSGRSRVVLEPLRPPDTADPTAVEGEALPDDAAEYSEAQAAELEVVRRGMERRFREQDGRDRVIRLAALAAGGLLVVAGIVLAIVLRPVDPIPDTPAGDRLRWIVSVMNDASVASIDAVEENFDTSIIASSSAGRLRRDLTLWDERGDGYDVALIPEPEADPHHLEAYVTNGAMDWGLIVVETASEPPYGIVRFTITGVDPPAGYAR